MCWSKDSSTHACRKTLLQPYNSDNVKCNCNSSPCNFFVKAAESHCKEAQGPQVADPCLKETNNSGIDDLVTFSIGPPSGQFLVVSKALKIAKSISVVSVLTVTEDKLQPSDVAHWALKVQLQYGF